MTHDQQFGLGICAMIMAAQVVFYFIRFGILVNKEMIQTGLWLGFASLLGSVILMAKISL